MNQKKTGLFLKQLRKAQNMTQEQVAEKIGVSSRTISRWETGEYMPDISILVDIAEMYEVDVREIIDGERMNDNLNSEVKEVAEICIEGMRPHAEEIGLLGTDHAE